MSIIKALKSLFYDVPVRCNNCRHEETVKIWVGTEVKDGLKNKPCSNCKTYNLVSSF